MLVVDLNLKNSFEEGKNKTNEKSENNDRNKKKPTRKEGKWKN